MQLIHGRIRYQLKESTQHGKKSYQQEYGGAINSQ